MHSFRPICYSLILALALTLPAPAAEPFLGRTLRLHQKGEPVDAFMGVRLRGALALTGSAALAEISDLAWDQDEQRLYAVTDRGMLLHLAPVFADERLVDVRLLKTFRLRNGKGKALSGADADAEGLALAGGDNGIAGDSRLAVSFERRHRIVLFTPQGKPIRALPLPEDLRNPRFYRNGNNGMEALALHPSLGYLSGPEKSPAGGSIPIYRIDNGWRWYYRPAEPNGALVAMEPFDQERLLVLERAYRSLFDPLVITLALVEIDADNRGTQLRSQPVARFDSSDGWLTQNLEGLTRHRGRRYFMVSDDSGEPFLQTQLIYFEVLAD